MVEKRTKLFAESFIVIEDKHGRHLLPRSRTSHQEKFTVALCLYPCAFSTEKILASIYSARASGCSGLLQCVQH
jgi:hypothetical protein